MNGKRRLDSVPSYINWYGEGSTCSDKGLLRGDVMLCLINVLDEFFASVFPVIWRQGAPLHKILIKI
jgi:hypothetical protein